ncbi:phosphatidylserine decarboxylase family protein [Oscillatoria laete-virens NRMC-F 0139]|nr:phosphatidylserine decarboxylase family protein [Oscillatoria laete-virens]MDL5055772.1 phosphatidylserine decarboxylase family protein [Oscillatoria laete-virens NRMC-F 0139]
MTESNLTWRYAKAPVLGLMLAWVILHVLLFFPFPDILKVAFMMLALGLVVILALIYNFFRNPDRQCDACEKCLVSPADGKVVAIEELEESDVLKTRMKRVAIFLNVFDVHVNRCPMDGVVEKRIYTEGKFLNAMDPECSNQNERQLWIIGQGEFKVAVRVIAGLIARRIIPWREEGQSLSRGERIGIIKFGSRTELYVPLDCEIKVKVGQRVKGGETVLASRP